MIKGKRFLNGGNSKCRGFYVGVGLLCFKSRKVSVVRLREGGRVDEVRVWMCFLCSIFGW